jgi:integrase
MTGTTNPTASTLLLDFGDHYCTTAHQRVKRQPKGATARMIKSICVKLHMMLGRSPVVSDLCNETLNRYTALLAESRYSDATIRTEREYILALWRFAADIGVMPIDPEHVSHRGRCCHHDESGNALSLSGAEGTLWHYCVAEYFKKNIRIRSYKTHRQYEYALLDLKQVLGHDPRPEDLTDDNVAAVMNLLMSKGLASKTANERASRLKALWNWLARRRVVADFPTIQRMKSPKRIPRAWTREELDKLFGACKRMGGKVGNVWASEFWQALLGVCWDSGERVGAILQMRWTWIDFATGDVLIEAEARKGQERDMAYRLHADTLASLQLIRDNGSELVFDWPYSNGTLYYHYRRLIKAAGLVHRKREAFHKIRKSVASHLQAAGHSACDALGHSTPAITKDSYLDPRIVAVASRPSEVLFRPGKRSSNTAAVVAVSLSPNEARKLPRAKVITA